MPPHWLHCPTVPVAVLVAPELVVVAVFVGLEVAVVVAVCVVVAGPEEQGEPVSRIWYASCAYVQPLLTFVSEKPADHLHVLVSK
jgi:hypothetical protein